MAAYSDPITYIPASAQAFAAANPNATIAQQVNGTSNVAGIPSKSAPMVSNNFEPATNGGPSTGETINGAPITPTVLSSTNIDQKNQTNQQILQQKSSTPVGQSLGQDGFARNADQTFAEAPSGAQLVSDGNGNQYYNFNGTNYALGPNGGKVSQDPTTQALYDQFTTLKGQMDATGAANIAAIQAQYEQLIAEQRQANAGAEASTYSLLARGGSLQTGSASGLLQGQVSYGLKQIGDLQSKENSAVIAAQQAQQNGDFQLLDKQLQIASAASAAKQAAAQKLNDTIQSATAQARKDSAITGVIQSGTTDPSAILAQLHAQGNDTVSLKDITDTISSLNPDQAEIYSTMKTAAANGAPAATISAIGGAKTLGDALSAAGQYVTDPTSLAGQFRAAVASGYNGTPGDWVAAQKYKEAYAAAAASQQAQANFTDSSAGQAKLFAQGVATLKSELSSRSGGLGLQDAKVNQAIHLKALFDQYAQTVNVRNEDPLTGLPLAGTHQETVYNIPRSQYTELAMGLASLISPSNTVAEGTINKITQSTAAGDLNQALTYATGQPQNGTTQFVLQNLKDSIDRQGSTAEAERQTYIDDLIERLPPGLSADNLQTLTDSAGLNSYDNPTPAQMTPAQIDSNAYSKIEAWASSDPKNQALLSDLSNQFPDLSNTELAQKLKLIPTP